MKGLRAVMWVRSSVLVAGLVATAAVAAGEIRTERLGDDLWRVRMSRDGKWTESALNRYGIIEKLPVQATECSPVAASRDATPYQAGGVRYCAEQVGKGFELRFPLAEGERVYGLGDAGRESLERRGRSYEIWVKNITGYIPIPMVMTSRGWGVLVNTTYRHTFDVGKTDKGALVVTAEEGDVDRLLADARPGDLLLVQLENPIPVVGYALRQAREKGMTTVLNPAPFDKAICEFLPFVDIVIPNETELRGLTDCECICEGAKALQAQGVLALTAGANVVRFLPPLVLKEDDLEEVVDMISEALDCLYGE